MNRKQRFNLPAEKEVLDAKCSKRKQKQNQNLANKQNNNKKGSISSHKIHMPLDAEDFHELFKSKKQLGKTTAVKSSWNNF